MRPLERAIFELERLEQRPAIDRINIAHIDGRAWLLSAILLLCFMLSLPSTSLGPLLLYFLYPILLCAIVGISYRKLLIQSFIVVPFAAVIGIFNPIINHHPALEFYGYTISIGWVEWIVIMLRTWLSTQVAFLLLYAIGFQNICRALQRLGLPSLLILQLLFVYRYLTVLVQETLCMVRAREARSYGRKSYPLKHWSQFIGQLLLRTLLRAQHIHQAMIARRFNGKIYNNSTAGKWRWKETLFISVWAFYFIIIRLYSNTLSAI